MKCASPHCIWISKDEGPCCLLFSLKHQSTDPARNRWVWNELWCLAAVSGSHTSVSNSWPNTEQECFGFCFFFPHIIWDFCFSFGSCLQQRKQFEYHTVISLPFWEWHLVFALLWCLPFYFLPPLLLPLERMLGLIKWPVDWMSDQVIWTCQSWVSVKAVKDRCSKPDCDGLLLSQKSLLCFVPQNSYLKSLDII